ncbi:carboxylesterase/lipase family protein [Terriglobus aquaticus]|uniref:Carboxylic ester hydrolase n=1 Tax=Terriglobus aquaticus TaxID=940139 RepID=A0ABW9KFL2_9BACT|nr:carboxylesterase/lipase family protein [Terriglobus aquaticus]
MPAKRCAALSFLLAVATLHAQTNQPVQTDKGAVIGKLSDDGQVRAFLGVPYAAPPVGPLRWQPPQPAAAWSAPRLAQSYGSHCVQVNQFADMHFHDAGESEDCLTLNVWVPRDAAPGAKLPVMVWIYGGGFYAGSTSEARQDGESFARKGVILVSMNYRLNIFGFFAHPALAAESPQHAAGNYGLMDQAAALQWVRRNIAQFGGDPGNITLFGESAGSASVSLQMASPLAKDTLAHAIGESGGAFSRTGLSAMPLATAEAKDEKFAQQVLGKTSLADLRAMSVADIKKAVEAQAAPAVRFGIVVDGLFLPEPAAQIFAEGKQAHIPLMAGWVRDEGGAPRPGMTLASYREQAQKTWGPNADAFLSAYSATTDTEAARAQADYMADAFIAASTWEWIEAQVKTGGAPVYRFHFEQPSPGGRYHPVNTGVFHSSEIEYVFGNLSARPSAPFTEADYKLSDTMQNYWVNFAKTGNPNGTGLPTWPAYNQADRWPVMHLIEPSPTAEPDTTRARYEFLRANKPVPGAAAR